MVSLVRPLRGCFLLGLLLGLGVPAALSPGPPAPPVQEKAEEHSLLLDAQSPSLSADPSPTSEEKAKEDERWGERNAFQWIISHGKGRFDVIELMSRPDLFTLGNLNVWADKED